jgi:outer membrane murein-binding lipoprotein Lpp
MITTPPYVKAAVVLGLLALVGCSSSDTSPAFTPDEHKEMRRAELSEELKTLIELEKQHGSDHSEVRQMKEAMGLDPNRPAAEQSL